MYLGFNCRKCKKVKNSKKVKNLEIVANEENVDKDFYFLTNGYNWYLFEYIQYTLPVVKTS